MTAPDDTYTRRYWHCPTCGRDGFVLLRSDDTAVKAKWRREQSHRAQMRRDRCDGHKLVWTPEPTGAADDRR